MNPARGMVIRRTRTHKSDTLAAHDNGEQASHSVQRNDDGTILQAWPARQTRNGRTAHGNHGNHGNQAGRLGPRNHGRNHLGT